MEDLPVGAKPKRSRKTLMTVGAAMAIAAGVLAIINGISAILGGDATFLGPEWEVTKYTVCGAIVVIFGILAILGGVSALHGRRLLLAAFGAFLGMMGDGEVGFFLGLGALVIYALTYEDT